PPLLVGELRRDGDPDANLGVAAAAAVDVRHAFAAQRDHPAMLGAGRDADLLAAAVDDRNLELGAERRLGDVDRQGADDVDALALKELVRLDLEDDVEVAGGAAARAGLAPAGHRQVLSGVDPARDSHVAPGHRPDASLAGALGAGAGDDPALAAAARTGL